MHRRLPAVAALHAFHRIRRDLKAIVANGGGTADAASLRPPSPRPPWPGGDCRWTSREERAEPEAAKHPS